MRVMFCWRTFEGYFGDCWRALARVPGVEVVVLAQEPREGSLAPYTTDVLAGVDARLIPAADLEDAGVLLEQIASVRPDVVVFPGWSNPAWRRAAMSRRLAGVPVVLAVDTPRRGTLRQRVGRWAYRGYLGRADMVVVAGERAWQLMRLLGVPEAKLRRGMYGIDAAALGGLHGERAAGGGWPRSFLFVGRYLDIKGIDELAGAYERYRRGVADPWPLVACGTGPMRERLVRAGAEDRGFVQPAAMGEVWRGAGALVLPSRYEPWGQVIVEAAAAGLPVICTESCGASVEVVRSHYNGLVAPTRDAGALAACLRWAHENERELPEMGRRSRALAAPYDAAVWAARWAAWTRGLLDG